MTSKDKPLAEIIADEVMDTIERERRINRDDLIAVVERRLPRLTLKVDRKTADELRAETFSRYHQDQMAKVLETKQRAAQWARLYGAVVDPSPTSPGTVVTQEGLAKAGWVVI